MAENSDKPAGSTVEAIFNEALGRPSGERAAYVVKACGADSRLRARVEALLRAREAPDGFLPDEPGEGPKLDLSKATEEPLLADEKPGDTIGRYKLLERIGEGGFGSVYIAEQKEPVKRKVALKIIKLGMNTRQVVARFQAERQALALMDHPSIAKIFDAGVTGDPNSQLSTLNSQLLLGRPYFVMELVQGIKITDYCDQNQLSTRQRLELFTQVCRAVQHAHQKGIIHRDLKPSNILVALRDGQPVPKIIDFGIAKATQAELTEQTVFTQFGHFIGTPAYMSPEQAELTRMDVDTRSDIYSLGVLLYELLTGTTPFETKELLSGGWEEMRRTIKHEEPPRPSIRLGTFDATALTAIAKRRQVEPPKLLHSVRGDLDWIVMKCLEKDRTRRYETANGLATDIQRHLNNEPVVARPPSRLYEFQKSVRRHKVGFAATTALIITLAAGFVVSTLQTVRARHAENEQRRLHLEADGAKRETTEALWTSYISEARALRYSGRSGQRLDALAVIRKAASIRPSPELRNEAIACLALADMRLIERKSFKRGEEGALPDSQFERYVFWDRTGVGSVRRVSDGSELLNLPGQGVAGGFFSPDGKFLYVQYTNDQARIFDLATSALALQANRAWSGVFSPDSKRFLAARKGANLVLYDLRGGAAPKTLSEQSILPSRYPSCHAVHPDGKLLAISSELQTNVLLLDAESGKEVKWLPHPDIVYKLAWHPDGRHLAAACGDNLVYIWDTQTGRVVRTLRGHQNTPIDVGFSHDGRLLVSMGWDGTRLWDFTTGRQLVVVEDTGFLVGFTPDDRKLGIRFWDGEGWALYEVASANVARTIHESERALGNPGGSAAFSVQGDLLAYPAAEGVKLWDVEAAKEIACVTGENRMLVGFDAQEQNLLIAGPEGLERFPIQKNEVGSKSLAPTAPTGFHPIGSVGCVSADGKVCAFMSNSFVQVILTSTFVQQFRADAGGPPLSGLALSAEGDLVVGAATRGGVVKVWDGRSGELVRDLPAEGFSMVALSPDGRYLAIANQRECQLWDLNTWSIRTRWPREKGPPSRMTFSHDGRLFASDLSVRLVRLFDTATGQVLADLEPPNPWQVTGLCFNADDTKLAVCEGRDALHLWDLRVLRNELASLGLDWDLPSYPPASPSAPRSR